MSKALKWSLVSLWVGLSGFPADAFAVLTNVCNRYDFDLRAGFASRTSDTNAPYDERHISWFTVPGNTCVGITTEQGAAWVGVTYDGDYQWGWDVPGTSVSVADSQSSPGHPVCVHKNPYQEYRQVTAMRSDGYRNTTWTCPNSLGEEESPYRIIMGRGATAQGVFTFDNSKLSRFRQRSAILFVNGASGRASHAGRQLDQLAEKFQAYAAENEFPDELSFHRFFIPTSGYATDLTNAIHQARCSDFGVCDDNDPLAPSLWNYYIRGELWGPKTTEAIASHTVSNANRLADDYTDQLVAKIRELYAADNRVVVVAHSQGTVVANRALASLSGDDARPFTSSILVGSITSGASGTWLTLNDDRVVNAARALLPTILPGNIENVSADIDPSNHGFLESYLHGNISGPELLRRIRELFRPMWYPGYPEETASTSPNYQLSPHAGEWETGSVSALVNEAVATTMACLNSVPACAVPPLPTNAVDELVAEVYAAAQACVAGAPGCPAPVNDLTSLFDQVSNAVSKAIEECSDDLAMCGVVAPNVGLIEELVAQVYGVARACLQGAPGCPVEGPPPVD